MNRTKYVIVGFGIFFLFLIQVAGSLVESIYILDLMNTSLDEKVLGLLFFFSPALLLLVGRKQPRLVIWILFGLLVLARGLTPYLNTLGRLLTSGIGTGSGLMLFPYLLTARAKEDATYFSSRWISAGFALAIGFSALLRTLNYGIDYSLFPEGGWVGWIFGGALGYILTLLDWTDAEKAQTSPGPITPAMLGIFLVIALAYFAFSAPAVIARWTEGDYRLIVIAISLLSVGWAGLSLRQLKIIDHIPPGWLLIWNLLFTSSLALTILVHRVPFPLSPDSPAVVVGNPAWQQHVPLILTILLFPVIFIDLRIFLHRIRQVDPRPQDLIPGMLLGSFSLVLLVFTHIFTNVWGYVEPVSPWFRNKFWLPYLLIAGLITILIGRRGMPAPGDQPEMMRDHSLGWAAFLLAILLGTAGSAFYTTRVQDFEPRSSTIVVMTYNIQQANDDFGERSYKEQLAMIREVAPDIIALQESDSTRISLNNHDYVRYYAGKLGYHSYFGPTTISGTYGTAILSRFPLQNTRTVFTYSDQDEVGTAEADFEINGELFTIYNVHPDGSDTAMLVWAETLLERSRGKDYVIAAGDYNLRDYEEAYQLIAAEYANAWESVYPSKIGQDGTDMSGENRIDHIFFSAALKARNPVYILPPQSATDHPVHWAELIR